MKYCAVCTDVKTIYSDIKMTDKGMKSTPILCDATFAIFYKVATDTFTIPFKISEAPTIGDKYVIEVTPCK